MVLSPGQMFLTHFIYIYCQDIWPDVIKAILLMLMVHVLPEPVGNRVSPTFMLWGFYSCLGIYLLFFYLSSGDLTNT